MRETHSSNCNPIAYPFGRKTSSKPRRAIAGAAARSPWRSAHSSMARKEGHGHRHMTLASLLNGECKGGLLPPLQQGALISRFEPESFVIHRDRIHVSLKPVKRGRLARVPDIEGQIAPIRGRSEGDQRLSRRSTSQSQSVGHQEATKRQPRGNQEAIKRPSAAYPLAHSGSSPIQVSASERATSYEPAAASAPDRFE